MAAVLPCVGADVDWDNVDEGRRWREDRLDALFASSLAWHETWTVVDLSVSDSYIRMFGVSRPYWAVPWRTFSEAAEDGNSGLTRRLVFCLDSIFRYAEGGGQLEQGDVAALTSLGTAVLTVTLTTPWKTRQWEQRERTPVEVVRALIQDREALWSATELVHHPFASRCCPCTGHREWNELLQTSHRERLGNWLNDLSPRRRITATTEPNTCSREEERKETEQRSKAAVVPTKEEEGSGGSGVDGGGGGGGGVDGGGGDGGCCDGDGVEGGVIMGPDVGMEWKEDTEHVTIWLSSQWWAKAMKTAGGRELAGGLGVDRETRLFEKVDSFGKRWKTPKPSHNSSSTSTTSASSSIGARSNRTFRKDAATSAESLLALLTIPFAVFSDFRGHTPAWGSGKREGAVGREGVVGRGRKGVRLAGVLRGREERGGEEEEERKGLERVGGGLEGGGGGLEKKDRLEWSEYAEALWESGWTHPARVVRTTLTAIHEDWRRWKVARELYSSCAFWVVVLAHLAAAIVDPLMVLHAYQSLDGVDLVFAWLHGATFLGALALHLGISSYFSSAYHGLRGIALAVAAPLTLPLPAPGARERQVEFDATPVPDGELGAATSAAGDVEQGQGVWKAPGVFERSEPRLTRFRPNEESFSEARVAARLKLRRQQLVTRASTLISISKRSFNSAAIVSIVAHVVAIGVPVLGLVGLVPGVLDAPFFSHFGVVPAICMVGALAISVLAFGAAISALIQVAELFEEVGNLMLSRFLELEDEEKAHMYAQAIDAPASIASPSPSIDPRLIYYFDTLLDDHGMLLQSCAATGDALHTPLTLACLLLVITFIAVDILALNTGSTLLLGFTFVIILVLGTLLLRPAAASLAISTVLDRVRKSTLGPLPHLVRLRASTFAVHLHNNKGLFRVAGLELNPTVLARALSILISTMLVIFRFVLDNSPL